MVTLKQRIAQQWPRFTVGLYAVWGIVFGLSSLWLGLHLNPLTDEKLLQSFDVLILGPEEEYRLVKSMLVIAGSLAVITKGIELYAAIRKSRWATKASLMFWFARVSWFVLFGIMALISVLSMSDRDRREFLRSSAWNWINMTLGVGSTLFHGWALLIFLRDVRLRQRNVWGQLVKTGGVFEYEHVELLESSEPFMKL
ncbi:hypothetical protein MVEG_01278 [Podila verticillata NRRL 6337]|nr:hypothetical protein MVEG_01278 [Podila verticillata NRRL 6337]